MIDIIKYTGLFFISSTFISFFNSFSSIDAKVSQVENYKRFCADCHGDQQEDFRSRTWVYGDSFDNVYKAIKDGYPDDGMPAYGDTLSLKEIEELTRFVLDESKKAPIVRPITFLESSGPVTSELMTFKVETILNDLEIPWGLAFLPGGDILITEKKGKLLRYRSGDLLQEINNVPNVVSRGQGGLMDIEVHPDFRKNRLIYLTYSKPHKNGKEATTAVWRARLVNNELVDGQDIFIALPYESTRHHYGSRLAFDRQGFLYVSVGDRGKRDRHPQNLDNYCGKIHRIHDNGRIPVDNPFVDRPGAVKSIFSYGHRNPQGMAIHPETGIIWINEHGPRGGDEVNIIQKGKNYGWPVISYGINYSGTKFTDLTHKKGMEQPVYYWDPSIGVCGMDFVIGDNYPAWKGHILAGSLRFEYLALLDIDDDKVVKEEKLLEDIGRLRAIRMGSDGFIYITAEGPGRVMRIMPVN